MVTWINGLGGHWDDGHNWDAGHVPGPTDCVVINMAVTVSHDLPLTHTVQRLTVTNGTLDLSNGTLNAGALSGPGTYRLRGGTLGYATVAAETTLTAWNSSPASSGTLNAVTLNGTLDLTHVDAAYVLVQNGLTVNGSVNLGNSDGSHGGGLSFTNTQTLGGTGSINMSSGGMDTPASGITVTLSSSLNIHGKYLYFNSLYSNSTFLDQTTIAVDVPGGVMSVYGSWTNSNAGFSAVAGAFVQLYGTVTNTGSTLTLSGAGQFRLFGTQGTIIGGTVIGTLTCLSFSGTLDGVAFDSGSTLDLTAGSVDVKNGLTVNGTVKLGASDGSQFGSLLFINTETVGGVGSIVFGGSTNNSMKLETAGITVTLGVGLTIHGKSGSFIRQYSSSTWLNQTTIAADVPGGVITVSGPWTNSNGGFSAVGGAFVYLFGTVTNTDSTLILSGAGQVQLWTCTIVGGTVVGTLTGTMAEGTLDGVTINGTLDLMTIDYNYVNVQNGLTINGTVNLGNSGGSTHATMYFSNSQTVNGPGSIVFGGSPSNLMQLNATGISVTLGPTLIVHGKSGTMSAFSGAAWVNDGVISADGSGGSLTLGGTWTNNGTFQAQNGGTLIALNAPTNYSGSTLTAGTWQAFANSTLRVNLSSGIVTNAATIVLDGANSNFYQDYGTTNALAPLAVIASGGSFTSQNGQNFLTAGNFTNNGTLSVGAGSTFTVNGDYTQGSAATLDIQLGGVGQSGNLNIAGNATLDGTLTLTPVNGYTPATGDSFQILTFAARNGTDFANPPAGFTEVFDDINGSLTVVAL
jgi:hypothetical protein